MSRPQSAGERRVPERSTGRYELRERLASGGMGTIYLAYDVFAKRQVAYKRLSIADEASRARRIALFQREYDSLAQLPHPNIVEVYDYGEDAEGPYYAMELLTGDDLTHLAPLPHREACRVLRDIASALALVHTRRLVHRDVSPNNVRLDASRKAKLLDFGALTPFGRPKELVGTPSFIAPECLDDAELDQRSDLYSLGALMYWALTRRTAVAARTLEELIDAWSEPPLPPSAHVADVPPELDELVLAMLSRDALARPPNAAYVIDRLTAIADLPPEADERRVAQSYLARPPLTGRAVVLDALSQAVTAAREGHGQHLLIEGEAGLGRSALLETTALFAQLAGTPVVRARGTVTAQPFRLVRTLVEGVSALYPDLASGPNTTSSILSNYPDRRRPAPDAVEQAARHATVIESAQATLLEASRRGPLVLLVDDAQLSDSESLALLASLAQEVGASPLSLVVTVTSGQPARDVAVFAKLASSATRYSLAPLSEPEVTELVQALFGNVPNSHRLGQWLHEQSGGNPAMIIDLTRLLLQRGLVRYTLGTFTLPHDVDSDVQTGDLSSAILARLGDLAADVDKLACILSLHDGSLTTAQLGEAADLPMRDVLLALEVLVRRGVAAQSELGYAFAGSSLRAALQKTLSPELSKALHLKLARALLAHPSTSGDHRFAASHHFLLAGHEDEAVSLTAGVAHTALFHEDAARWAPLTEAVLAISIKRGYSKEQCLSLMLPLAAAGFHGNLHAQTRYIDAALAGMAQVCGMVLARRLRPYCGGKLALGLGFFYAALRRALTPKQHRLGTLRYMMAYFIGLACDASASAVSALDTPAAARFLRWLEPLSVLPEGSAGYVMREFCRATVEIGEGRFAQASQRFAALQPLLSKPVEGLENKGTRRILYLGCLNGRGACEALESNPVVLELAEELRDDAFFAAHAEVIVTCYYACRGDAESAADHRARAELLALRGGTSWAAAMGLVVRLTCAAMVTLDAIALVQLIAELDRLAALGPKLKPFKTVAEGWLEHLRGRSDKALALFEQVIDTEDARALPTARSDNAFYAALLNAMGLHQRAKEVCLRSQRALPPIEANRQPGRHAMRELAIAEAGLGNHAEAAAIADSQIAAVPYGNALELGNAHRDRAIVALHAKDRAAFDEHFEAMGRYFRETRNPCLIGQRDTLLARAVRAGVRAETRTRPSQAEPDNDQLDGHTIVESLPTRQSG